MDAALDLILSQTRQNILFLIDHNKLSPSDGRVILDKLDAPNASGLEARTANLSLGNPTPTRARALWGFNEHATNPNDLSFRPGDIIYIKAETNPDWWTGEFNGREGLFPANYVEKLPWDEKASMPAAAFPSGPPGPVYAPPRGPAPGVGGYLPPGPPAGPYPGNGGYQPGYQQGPPPMSMGYGQPPPPQSGYTNYAPPPMNNVVPQQTTQAAAPPPIPPKKGKFGGQLGSNLANSAVSGLGFGAGSAVGSDIVNHLF
ncbi:Peptide hydrolase [Mycena chlorophos]|uniref:Peptide hydrolase n=1 Tax=Mycena chlorophos TaxID=658473 RepID=A0A8H6TGB7_MYCCL|nr:Peptide hydrolase [Mycena chlorophos]